jgi:hypothetical protein
VRHLTPDGRLPFELCSVCKYEYFATGYCTCSPAALLERGDITQEEAYAMIGVQPPDDSTTGHVLPFGTRRQSRFDRLMNMWKSWTYRRRTGTACRHDRVTPWHMMNTGASQLRWCRDCGCTEVR